MFLGMQYFDFSKPNQIFLNVIITFAQISSQFCPNLITFFFSNSALILPTFRPNLTKFAQI